MKIAGDIILRILSMISIEIDVDQIAEWTKTLFEVVAHF